MLLLNFTVEPASYDIYRGAGIHNGAEFFWSRLLLVFTVEPAPFHRAAGSFWCRLLLIFTVEPAPFDFYRGAGSFGAGPF